MVVDDSRRLLVGHINDDFDVDELGRDEEEQEEEERIDDVVSNDLEDSVGEQGGRDAMPVPVQGRLVRDVPRPSQVQHAMPV
jgi:hypothetical protein